MDQAKYTFLKESFIPLVNSLEKEMTSKWGKMNVQQMLEHVAGFFRVSTEKLKFPLITPVEHLPKYREFLFSDKAFRENTQAPGGILPEEPLPPHFPTLEDAKAFLIAELNYFFKYFEDKPGHKTLHPAFGELNFEEWVLLHYKHVRHHLKQFGHLPII